MMDAATGAGAGTQRRARDDNGGKERADDN